ncbi:uncharacterized protein LOC115265775 [Aedes albopictus]|uniref:N-acetyltransferase domain-containing protein n=1 Tax=Aedes albopictus TaxID=7160 RepID=A0ABM1XLQ3_AEDAL
MEAASSNGIQFRQAISTDREALREALAKFFYPEEPLTVGYYRGSDVTDDDMEFSLSLIEEGFVWLGVEEKSGRIVALSGGAFSEPDEAQQLIDFAGRTESKKFADILRLLGRLALEVDVFNRFGVSKVYHLHYLAVDSRLRGRSLGRILMGKQFEHARECGAKVLCADVTGFYSAKLFESLGLQCVKSIDYKKYFDEDGQQMFLVEEPHVCIKGMVKILE